MQKVDLFIKRINIFGEEKHKKSAIRILYELSKLTLVKKELPTYYFGKFLYKKEVKNYIDYLSTKEASRIIRRGLFNKFDYYSILTNKISFALYCSKNKIPVQQIYCYNLKSRFFYGNQITDIRAEKKLINFYSNVFSSSGFDSLFIKPISGEGGGTGCFIINKENLNDNILSI